MKMRVYIASKYCEHDINREIAKRLKQVDIDYFLPESIEKQETNLDAAREIAVRCYSEVRHSNVVLAIDAQAEYGSDVGAEVGYAIALQETGNFQITLVNLQLCEIRIPIRAMNDPYFSYVASSVDDLINFLLEEKKKEDSNSQC